MAKFTVERKEETHFISVLDLNYLQSISIDVELMEYRHANGMAIVDRIMFELPQTIQ